MKPKIKNIPINDYFVAKNVGNQIQIKSKGKTLHKQGNDPQTCFANKVINSQHIGIYKWTFKLVRCEHQMVVGISSNHKMTDRAFYRNQKDHNYGYDVFNGQKVSKNKFAAYGCKCSREDKIEMKLNLNKKQLSFIVNDIDQGVAYNDIAQGKNVNYKLAITLKAKGQCIALTNYQEAITNEKETNKNEEEKYDKKVAIKSDLKTVKSPSKMSKSINSEKQFAEIQKISKQLEEQRAAQHKMDKRLKNILESLKEIKKTLKIKHNPKHDVEDENVDIASSDSRCSRWMYNVKMMLVGIFILMMNALIVFYVVPYYLSVTSGKSEL